MNQAVHAKSRETSLYKRRRCNLGFYSHIKSTLNMKEGQFQPSTSLHFCFLNFLFCDTSVYKNKMGCKNQFVLTLTSTVS